MKFVFFDEAKHDAKYPHYHIGGVCIDESDLNEIEGYVSELSNSAFGAAELSRATEFHAAEIFHRKRTFKDWLDFGRRVEVIGKLAEILSFDSVQRIAIQINCERLYGGSDPPENFAFMFFCEKANALVKSQKSLGMLIGDRESDQHADRFARTLSGYRASGTEFEFGREIQNLVDSVHFTHSHLSRFLQLADTYAWILQFRNRNRNSENPYHRTLLERLKKVDLFPSTYKTWPGQFD